MLTRSRLTAAGCAIAGVLALTSTASAGPIVVEVQDFGTNLGAAQTAIGNLTAGKQSVTEDFEEFTSGQLINGGLATDVGIFKKGAGSDGTGVCDAKDADCSSPGILNAAGSPFGGRQNTTLGGDNWLDSNDYTDMIWDVDVAGLSAFHTLAFLATDIGDVGGTLTVAFENGANASVNLFDQSNGEINLITATFDPKVVSATVTFSNTAKNDGFGIDDATAIPIPATFGLLGLGLIGLGAVGSRRRIRR